MQPIYLICGVPGAGKTWVCHRLSNKFNYLKQDLFRKNHAAALVEASKHSTKPVITEVPFAERLLKAELEKAGITVHPYFVVEAADIVAGRYKAREGKAPAQNVLTRAGTIINRAREWKAPFGTSAEILKMLQGEH